MPRHTNPNAKARSLKDVQIFVARAQATDGDTLGRNPRIAPKRMRRWESHGWVENVRTEMIGVHQATVADLTDTGRQIRDTVAIEDVQDARSITEVIG